MLRPCLEWYTTFKNEMNANMSHNDFICCLKGKGWNLDVLYVDHYRMPNAYVCDSFPKQFFINIKLLAKEDVLMNNAMTMSGRSEIYLPSCPHLCLRVHYHKLHEEYDVLYISEVDLITNSKINYLHSATKYDNHVILATSFEVTMLKKERCVKYSKKNTKLYGPQLS